MHIGPVPVTSVTECANAAVKGVIRGSHYVTVPFYYSAFLLYRMFAPEVLDWIFRLIFVKHPQKPEQTGTESLRGSQGFVPNKYSEGRLNHQIMRQVDLFRALEGSNIKWEHNSFEMLLFYLTASHIVCDLHE